MKPQPKVAAGGVGGAVAIILVWALGYAGVDVTAEVAAAITSVISFAFAYIKK